MEADFLNPTHECDLVMKGGITSGIVYPPVVLKLAAKDSKNPEYKSYRFRSIGGTSAGAIAAAVTAAAEYGRETGGFKTLQEVNEQLSQPGFLLNLFHPSTETKPLYDTFSALFRDKKSPNQSVKTRLLNRLFRLIKILRHTDSQEFSAGAVKGIQIGLLLALVLSAISFLVFFLTDGSFNWQGFVVLLLLFGVALGGLGWLLGGLINSGFHLWNILTQKIPQNNFGMCSGLGGKEVLTEWLSAKVNEAAGKLANDPPLTFGELSKKKLIDGQDVAINLKMVTSNLSQNQPYDLPFRNHLFLFKEEEFRQLFPASIVNYMTQLKYPDKACELPEGFYFFPEADDLPVAVAMRMSLSFPLLIGAVPLYTMSQAAFERKENNLPLKLKPEDLQKNWFSDGGISSNFPIHFFDSWLPGRPTFGINLTSLPRKAFTEQNGDTPQIAKANFSIPLTPIKGENLSNSAIDVLSKAVYIPKADDLIQPEWVEINSLISFIRAIFSTAQNYRDNTQSLLPSYRERIVQVRLSDDEGGLNLTMPDDTIKLVMAKGEKAGDKILKHFKFEHHQWVRFQVLMGLLEKQLQNMEKVLGQKLDYENLAKAQKDDEQQYPYRREEQWLEEALSRVKEIQKLIGEWKNKPVLSLDTPLPDPVLRVTPEL